MVRTHDSIRGNGSRRRGVFFSFARFTALLHQLGDNSSPPGLMTGSKAGTGISMEVFMKENQVAPVRIGLELFEIAEHRPSTFCVSKKNVGHAAGQFTRNIPKCQHLA